MLIIFSVAHLWSVIRPVVVWSKQCLIFSRYCHFLASESHFLPS